MSLEKNIAEVFALPESAVTDSLALNDIPTWDSLAHMMLIVRLEETYQVQFSGDEIADLRAIGDIRNTLRAHGAAV
ncbi:acyl carrier protein [Betaproteobacteria bacterium SCN1]|jgi:acyl carrier protein|nr:acyl carrier protein [Betaproteobacteria bacterium SCN1]